MNTDHGTDRGDVYAVSFQDARGDCGNKSFSSPEECEDYVNANMYKWKSHSIFLLVPEPNSPYYIVGVPIAESTLKPWMRNL